ncbi:hypothetical protein [Micromonospora inyonensis]|uniref:DUF1376 domain-containing protein n=1 Tax=Micromonospora inyonensis TaxID=47866 RepID=A0A1C6RX38_9ACTN|nr:hypothetical protein [Micromonospora inyonensis]SCL12804.1 hypothetical protein GA0074694_0004 [Micromonospora inyonensis]SCL21633.1 hypothetical protein GA0074694_3095 [Micromonospora inyonensis]
MPWFKVDDGLHAHMKAVRAGVPAMGLWVLAGSWSSSQLTDGWVPDYIAARLDPDYREHAATLVRAGLWEEDEHDGDKGWRFHQWDDHQPSSEEVLAKREAARERMRRIREQRSPGSQDVRANVRENIAGSSPNPDPTRPDPTRTSYGSSVGTPSASPSAPPTTTRGTRISGDFDVTPAMRAWAREKAPNVDVAVETANFVDHWTSKAGKDAVKNDWTAAWRTWMRKAQQWKTDRAQTGGSRTTGANRHVDRRTDNPFAGGANATVASQHTGGHR